VRVAIIGAAEAAVVGVAEALAALVATVVGALTCGALDGTGALRFAVGWAGAGVFVAPPHAASNAPRETVPPAATNCRRVSCARPK
jgi:hypothetical protein